MKKKKPRQLYFKLFWTYIAIAFFIVLSLTVYFISALVRDTLNNRQENGQRICKEAAAYVKDGMEAADYLFSELYRENQELRDILAFLNLPPDKYQEYSLNEYSQSNSQQYRGTQLFVTSAFEAYPKMEKIELISYEDKLLTTFYPQKVVYPYKDGKERFLQIQDPGYALEGKLQFVKTIIDPATMKQEGAIVFTFSLETYIDELAVKEEDLDLLVLKNNESFVCMPKGFIDWTVLLQEESAVPGYELYKEQQENYQIYGILDRKKASLPSVSTLAAILLMGILIFGSGVVAINFYIKHLTHRVEVILHGMDQVTTGNLQIKLEVNENGDELDMISGNFNEMCRKLDLYIRKSYLAEIEKKNAELQTLQSQINPHFLYNTLEAIRMKAICNGDRDVGKMLYSMSVLFRSQLKEADWITVGQELDYCKQYLELFEYRYQNIFTYDISCPVELLGTKVIKFILQPIIENYFIHGIRRQDTDNVIRLTVSGKDGELFFVVEDNGAGMEALLLEQKNAELEKSEYRQTNSVGIENVNRRIKAVYGNTYGIVLEHGANGGMSVKIRVKMESGDL